MIAISKKKHAINALSSQTNALVAENQKLLKMIRVPMQDAIKEGNSLADAPVGADKKSISEHHHALDIWLAKYKKLSGVALPLGKINALLDTSGSNLKEWDAIIAQEWDAVFHHFLIRVAILCASLIVPFVFLELAHKTILRYVKDISRVRQLNIARQVVFVTLLVMVFFLNFFTEFGSLATYAGFLTAGLAVALQTVLVSLTAHFFFFGRFGVRAGDRVTISGVTGDVVQVGMLRIYLMELIGDKNALRPSGKIVAFPNSVLFNATAFSKQVPGTSYTWNDLTFLLDPESDFTLANNRILDVVNSVFGEYKKIIDNQYTSLEQSTNLSVGLPTPRSEVRIKDIGLVCDVHYPVTMERAAKVYEQMIKKLIAAFESDKDFRLVLSNPLKIAARNKA
jgi:small-conductance mechanosensitive channel